MAKLFGPNTRRSRTATEPRALGRTQARCLPSLRDCVLAFLSTCRCSDFSYRHKFPAPYLFTYFKKKNQTRRQTEELGHLLSRWLCLGREVDKMLKSQILLFDFRREGMLSVARKKFFVESELLYFLLKKQLTNPRPMNCDVHHGSITLLSFCLSSLPHYTV